MNGRQRGALLREMIFDAYAAAEKPRRANSLRMGDVGKPCSRSLWYRFRWADKLVAFEGRMLRLFQTGHSQEDRLIADLRKVGARVISRDPNAVSVKGEATQIAASAMQGHSKGFLDGVAEAVPHASASWVVTECKTHSAKSFKKLETDGVAVSKPEHFGQIQSYLREHKLQEALYLAVNKDTDDLYCEFIPYDDHYANQLLVKSREIIYSPEPPRKINASPEFYLCKFCDAHDVCHGGKLPERNCRTCIESSPVPETAERSATWHCRLHDKFLTLDEQQSGCGDHRYNPALVPGVQVDLSDDKAGIKYEIRGGVWEDRGSAGSAELPA